MALKALNKYLVVTMDEAITKTELGLYLETSQIQKTATVVSVGSLCESTVRPGDKILLPKQAQFEKFTHEKKEYCIIQEDRALVVLNDGENSGS